jgi:5-methylcytosine-specific restriction protein A
MPNSLPTAKVSTTYDHKWKKLRDRRIQAEPLCRHCLAKGHVTPAEQVDHIIPRVQGGTDEWDNTQSLCGPCHRTKTADENRERFSNNKRG